MNIGVDLSWCAGSDSGIGMYATQAMRAYARCYPDDTVTGFITHEFPAPLAAGLREADIALQRVPLANREGRLAHALVKRLIMPAAAWRTNLDLYFAPNFLSFADLPPRVARAAMVPDLTFLLYPELCRPGFADLLREHVPAFARACDVLVTISDTAREQIAERLMIAPTRLVVAAPGYLPYPGPPPATGILARLGVTRGRYLLSVGTIEPRKNYALAIAAFSEYCRQGGENESYVIIGADGWDCTAVHAAAAAVPGVVMAGRVTEEEKEQLYDNARLFLMTSIYEGFGIPLIEALAHELPVVTTAAGGVAQEVLGAVGTIAPASVSALAHALRAAERQPLPIAAQQVTEMYTWEHCAASLHQAFAAGVAMKRANGRIQ